MSTDTPLRRALLLLCTLPLAEACTAPRLDLKRMTYEALRREDCRLNRLEEFCQRTFANDYIEYERVRRRFIREQSERASESRSDEAFR